LDVMQAIRERRSIRKYRADPIREEALHAIFEAARWAPSWGNTQCLRLVVVQDQATKSKLAETLRSTRPEGKNGATEAVRNAPVVLVACAERRLSGYNRSGDKQGTPATDKGEWWFMFDLGLAMQNVTLAAHALGLGTVHVGRCCQSAKWDTFGTEHFGIVKRCEQAPSGPDCSLCGG